MRDILNEAGKAGQLDDIGEAVKPGSGSNWPRRFYKTCDVRETDNGFEILLDDRPVKTPGKNVLILPGNASAELVAAEWSAVEEYINPLQMPVCRIVNTAIDGVSQEAAAVFEDIVRYAGSDLLCYRADSPAGLVKNQQKHWDPVLDWLQAETGAVFETSTGIMHVEQSSASIRKIADRLSRYKEPLLLASLHTITSISGSAILALALADNHLDADKAWDAAHVDEDWNISQWGEDFEAAEKRKIRWAEFSAALQLMKAVMEDTP